MNAGLRTALFAAAVVLQLGLPVGQILRYEQTLREGEGIRLRTRPVDPYDPFRGRYVRLGFERWTVPMPESIDSRRPVRHLYLTFTNDVDGFAYPDRASRTRPAGGSYLRVDAPRYLSNPLQLSPPFDRFYANEARAPELERAYREAHAAGRTNAYADVRLYRGRGVLADLVLPDAGGSK